MTSSTAAKLFADVKGGLVSALVAIPLAIGFGMSAFLALGEAYFGQGVVAGLYAALIVGVVSVILGDRSTTIYAPRVVTTFFLGSLLYSLVHSDSAMIRAGGAHITLAIFFSIILLGGAFQASFGLIRLGSLIKFTPHPVMAGFQNAAALLLFLVQISNVLGYSRHVPLSRLVASLPEARPLSVVVAGVGFAAMWHAKRLLPKVPPLIVGLGAGTLCYYAFALLGLAASLGPVIGTTPEVALEPSNLPNFLPLAQDPALVGLLPTIIGGALSLAMIGSIDALLCARLIEERATPELASDRQMARLGMGNIAAACFGGITSGINIAASTANRGYGGRTALSALVNAGAVLVTLLWLLPVIAYLPQAVLSAVIMVAAVRHLDPWTMRLVRQLAAGRIISRWDVVLELSVVLLVAILSIALNIVVAVFAGVFIAIAVFLLRMSRSVVRRHYRGDIVHSRKMRDRASTEFLAEAGRQILVLELEGAIFFGSGERLAGAVERMVREATAFLVLDLRRVTEIDSTGAQILLRLHDRLAEQGGRLLISGLDQQAHWGRLLIDLGVTAKVTPTKLFADEDRAIEWAEDQLLAREPGDRDGAHELAFEDLEMVASLDRSELAVIRPLFVRRTFEKGEIVFREGDPGTELFVITEGSASVEIGRSEGGTTRLRTFSPGTFFGELALIDKGNRSATVIADDRLICHALKESDLAWLAETHPAIAIKLVASIAGELSHRLRLANRTIHQLSA